MTRSGTYIHIAVSLCLNLSVEGQTILLVLSLCNS